MSTFHKFEYFVSFIVWGFFLYMVALEPDFSESVQYMAGVIAASAYMRALEAKESKAND